MQIKTSLFLAAFVACLMFAQSALADETPRARIETMVAALQPGNLDQAIDAFAKNSVMRPELVDQMKAQVRAALPGEKKVLGFEFIEETNPCIRMGIPFTVTCRPTSKLVTVWGNAIVGQRS